MKVLLLLMISTVIFAEDFPYQGIYQYVNNSPNEKGNIKVKDKKFEIDSIPISCEFTKKNIILKFKVGDENGELKMEIQSFSKEKNNKFNITCILLAEMDGDEGGKKIKKIIRGDPQNILLSIDKNKLLIFHDNESDNFDLYESK